MREGNKRVYNKRMEYYLITYNSNTEMSLKFFYFNYDFKILLIGTVGA